MICDEHLLEDSPQVEIMKTETGCTERREERLLEEERKNTETKDFLEKLYSSQRNSSNNIYHAYNARHVKNLIYKYEPIKFPQECLAKYEEVVVDEDKWMEIAFHSVSQSNSSVWFKERLLRITCSKKAHRIKSRITNFDDLARQLSNEKSKGGRAPAPMQYGIDTESTARSVFEESYGYYVYEVGLIISPEQPYLACSPDGVICIDGTFELLEIKCPYSCANTKIVDLDLKMLFVPYLIFDESGKLSLKESDQY